MNVCFHKKGDKESGTSCFIGKTVFSIVVCPVGCGEAEILKNRLILVFRGNRPRVGEIAISVSIQISSEDSKMQGCQYRCSQRVFHILSSFAALDIRACKWCIVTFSKKSKLLRLMLMWADPTGELSDAGYLKVN
jgi:hypothetical protein